MRCNGSLTISTWRCVAMFSGCCSLQSCLWLCQRPVKRKNLQQQPFHQHDLQSSDLHNQPSVRAFQTKLNQDLSDPREDQDLRVDRREGQDPQEDPRLDRREGHDHREDLREGLSDLPVDRREDQDPQEDLRLDRQDLHQHLR